MASLIDRGRKLRPLVKSAQFALTGGYVRRMFRNIAADLQGGPHESILDLGSGDSHILRELSPPTYVGLDINEVWLAAAERKYGAPGRTFKVADLTHESLEPYRGFDAAICTAVFHHLPDEAVTSLTEKIAREAAPKRVVCADTLMIGPMKGVIARLDEGEPVRSKDELYALLEPRFEIEETWSFEVPLRTAHLWGFILTPRTSSASGS